MNNSNKAKKGQDIIRWVICRSRKLKSGKVIYPKNGGVFKFPVRRKAA